MADSKISALPSKTTFSGADFAVIVDNSTSPPTSKKILLSLIQNTPVVPFSANFLVAYTTTSLPYYNSANTSTVTWNLTTVGTTTAIALNIRDGTNIQNVTVATGTTPPFRNTGLTYSGTVTGNDSAGTSTVIPISGSVAAIPIYVPAFYTQTLNSTVPTFTTVSPQTTGAATGSTITYPAATLATEYDWIAVDSTIAVGKILVITNFGNVPITADVGPVAQTISGRAFNVYGLTNLNVGQALSLYISA